MTKRQDSASFRNESKEANIIDAAPVTPKSTYPVAASPLDLPAEVFASGLQRRKENRRELMAWIRSSLVEGVDFGRIMTRRGLSKPSLWKPGAEKICGMLGVTVRFPTLEHYEQAALNAVELHNIILRCEIVDAEGRVVANGIGARSLKQDCGDINKTLKMAEKSAHIDATLRMAGLSEVFTQDLEDLPPASQAAASGSQRSQVAGKSAEGSPVASGESTGAVAPGQRKRLEEKIRRAGFDRQRVENWLARASHGRVRSITELTPAQFEQLEARIDQWMQERRTSRAPA